MTRTRETAMAINYARRGILAMEDTLSHMPPEPRFIMQFLANKTGRDLVLAAIDVYLGSYRVPFWGEKKAVRLIRERVLGYTARHLVKYGPCQGLHEYAVDGVAEVEDFLKGEGQ